MSSALCYVKSLPGVVVVVVAGHATVASCSLRESRVRNAVVDSGQGRSDATKRRRGSDADGRAAQSDAVLESTTSPLGPAVKRWRWSEQAEQAGRQLAKQKTQSRRRLRLRLRLGEGRRGAGVGVGR